MGTDIVGDIGDMHAHFVVSVGQTADRECIVEVLGILGVDRESRHIAHVLACGHDLGRDSGVDLLGSLLHGLGVSVGKSELSKDGMDLGIVLAGFSKDVDDLALGVLGVVGPVCYAGNSLVA